MTRDYNIPESKYGFYGTGLFNDSQDIKKEFGNLITPIQKYCEAVFARNPPHISCRYLGYHDEIETERIDLIRPQLRTIYKKFIPVEFKIKRFFGTWEQRPGRDRQLLMLEIDSSAIKELQNELLGLTQDFPLFSGTVGANFRPHISISTLLPQYARNIPQEVVSFFRNFRPSDKSFAFNKAFIVLSGTKMEDL